MVRSVSSRIRLGDRFPGSKCVVGYLVGGIRRGDRALASRDVSNPGIHPNDALMVFPFADDYSFGILQSDFHWEWFINRCSTMKGDPRYTSNTVFATFPWPQAPTKKLVQEVARAAREVRTARRKLAVKHRRTLRALYRETENPGEHPLKTAQEKLDAAVAVAYGAKQTENRLAFLLKLNGTVAQAEQTKQPVTGPGLPAAFASVANLFSDDRIEPPGKL